MLTEADYREIADRLANSTGNVFTVSRSSYKHEWTEDDGDNLERIGRIKRCVECSVWHSADTFHGDFCDECDAMNDTADTFQDDGEDDDDED